MPVLPADLVAPSGPIEATLFPGENVGAPPTALDTRLAEYISQAEAKTAGVAFPSPEAADEAVANWALHLAFSAAYRIAVSRPASENSMVPVIGSQSYSKDQRDALKALAQDYADKYSENLAAIPEEGIQPTSYQSRQSVNRFVW